MIPYLIKQMASSATVLVFGYVESGLDMLGFLLNVLARRAAYSLHWTLFKWEHRLRRQLSAPSTFPSPPPPPPRRASCRRLDEVRGS